MAVGRAAFQSASDINATVGGICLEMDNLMDSIARVQTFMAATDLTVAPFSMTSGDSAIVKGALVVLDAVRVQYNAQGNITFVKQCMGIPR